MSIILEILRQRTKESEPYLQSFLYEPEGAADTVAAALKRLNEREPLLDTEGNRAEPVRWESSCLQKRCGACAMVINGKPSLACDTRLSALPKRVRIEPLRKFPVICDLITDRRIMFDNLLSLGTWFSEAAEKMGADLDEQRTETAFEASRCLQCGCCLEVCPNFDPSGSFPGMAAAVPLARLLKVLPETEQDEIRDRYRRQFYEGCGKSFACQDICPAGIPADELMARSNAAAVWRIPWNIRRKK